MTVKTVVEIRTVTAPTTTPAATSGTTSATTQPSTSQTAGTDSPPTCKSITEGSTPANPVDISHRLCTDSGQFYELSTDDHAVSLAGLEAQFVSAHTETSLSDSSGVASANANGVFLIITLRITNTGNQPQTVEEPGAESFALSPLGSSATYTESFNAENGPDEDSFISDDTPIQPGESQTGDIIFDVPPTALTTMQTSGAALVFGAFGVDLSNATTSKTNPAALLLIYHNDI